MTDVIEGEFQPLAVREDAAVPSIVAWTPRFVMPIDQMVQASDDMTEFQRRVMKDGIHYGVTPGTDKPTLWKPGAELLLSRMALHCSDPIILSEVIDYGDCTADGTMVREGLIRFTVRRDVYHQTGANEAERIRVASGVGSCTSREKKYRWRSADRVCPHCGKPAIIKGKEQYGGGWLCWKKREGCDAKFRDDDPQIKGQAAGKVFNPDLADLENTILKMAAKRALIDATLLATGCSNVFTQDVGDDSRDPDDAPLPPAPPPPPELPHPSMQQLAALAATRGIEDKAAWIAWLKVLAPDLARRHNKALTPQEAIEAERRLRAMTIVEHRAEEAAHLPADPAPRTSRPAEGSDEPGPDIAAKMAPRIRGRLFALFEERLSKEREVQLTWAASNGVVVESRSEITELQARGLIRKLEMIPLPRGAEPDPDDLADYADRMLPEQPG